MMTPTQASQTSLTRFRILVLASACASIIALAVGAPVDTWSSAPFMSSNDYNVSLGQHYLNLSWAAFCTEDVIMDWNCKKFCVDRQFTPFGVFQDNLTEAYGFVGYDKELGETVVSFRGSDNTPNWITDFDFIKVDFNGSKARVHDGFYVAWQRVADQVTALVDKTLEQHSDTKRIVCTGHSLGAAISGLCAIELAAVYQPKGLHVHMHNFGMPRVGDEDFSSLFKKRVSSHFRVVSHHDIVPHVPFKDIGFYHVPTEVWDMSPVDDPISKHQIKVCDGSGEDPTCSDTVPAWEWRPSDHGFYLGIEFTGCSA